MNKLGRSVISALLLGGALALAGCADDTTTTAAGTPGVFGTGPVTGPGPGPGPTPTPGPTGNRVQLLSSSTQMPSSGATNVDLTAIVLDPNGQAVSGSAVVFSTGSDPTAFINNISGGGVSDSNGLVTAKLNLGFNKSNRFISVTATADGAIGTTGVDVTGTTITISGNSSLAFGATTTLTFSLNDSVGAALPGITMSVASAAGNAVGRIPASGITNASGQISAAITAIQAGNDVITATAAGASKTQALTVSSASFAFTTPAPSVDIPLGVSTPVSIRWTDAGVPQTGQPVSFSTSRGTIAGSPSTTNASGDTPGVSVVSSTSAGPAIITASGPTGTPAATLSVTFVATTATSAAVQAVPGTVQVTTGSPNQTNNVSAISVTVRDGNNNLVKNASINFTLTDSTGGSIASGSAITDVNGSASVNYTAGPTSSAQNGVTVTATVDKVNGIPIALITSSTTLTVSGQALLVRLGTDNLVQLLPAPDPNIQKRWSAIVTDAAGNAVVGATVRFTLRPGRYVKGRYDFIDTAVAPAVAPNKWVQTITTPQTAPNFPDCANEDVNFNGILDPGEDFNGSLALEPGGVATVNATGTTDANGSTIAVLTYPKNYASWAEVILEARTGVAGNDPPTSVNFFLVGLASDYLDKTVAPPGVVSPFGVGANCSDTN